MSSRIDPLEPGETGDEVTDELLREANAVYEDSAYFGAIAHKPELFRRLLQLFDPFPDSDALDEELLEVARLAVAEANGCAYCATVRNKDVEEAVSEKERAVFGDPDAEDLLSDEERLAVELAERLSTEPHRITDEFVADLRESFGEEGFVELLLFVSLEVGLDRFTIALELTPDEKSPYPSDLEYPFEADDV
jgi:AhpD family alkylhydroperoxidase